MRDLHQLPKFRDSLSYLYVEHCKIDQDGKAISMHDANGKVPIPCAALSVLMLGPGTDITHAAIKVLSDTGCLVIWCGEQGVRFYAHGTGETRRASNLIKQAKLCSDPKLRLIAVKRLYQLRFKETLPDDLTLEQIRGKEGIRVREGYAKASRETGIEWKGRNYNRADWNSSDTVNRALSAANSCLYGITHAAIVSLGYSPGLGFIHTGKQLSFVYDIADFYKVDITIPIAFSIAASSSTNIERDARMACRDKFEETRLLARIVEDLEKFFDISELKDYEIFAGSDEDPALPSKIWDEKGILDGGLNYSDNEG